MTMNDNIEFRFVTRTLREDYHVYADNGNAIFSDQTEFAPLRAKCSIRPEDGGCAALFEDNGKIFLVVSGLSTGRKDFAGRPIRFSFCRIFQDSSQNNKAKSYASLIKIITQWQQVESTLQSLFHEKDNSVHFDQQTFIDWLQAQSLPTFNFEICKHGDVRGACDIIWPSLNSMLKWLYSEADEIVCI